ncbi:MAG: hypothetical protein AB7W44_01045 [Pyrinomonadaceae bacterium]
MSFVLYKSALILETKPNAAFQTALDTSLDSLRPFHQIINAHEKQAADNWRSSKKARKG